MKNYIETVMTGTVRDYHLIDSTHLGHVIAERGKRERNSFNEMLVMALDPDNNNMINCSMDTPLATNVFDTLCSGTALEHDDIGVLTRAGGCRPSKRKLVVYPDEYTLHNRVLTATVQDQTFHIDLDGDVPLQAGDHVLYMVIQFFGRVTPLVILRFTVEPAHNPTCNLGLVIEKDLALSTGEVTIHTTEQRETALEPFNQALDNPELSGTGRKALQDARSQYQADLLLSSVQQLCRMYRELVFTCTDRLTNYYTRCRQPQTARQNRVRNRAAWLPAVITDICGAYNVNTRFMSMAALRGLIATCTRCGHRANIQTQQDIAVTCPSCGSRAVGSLRSAAAILEAVTMFR